MWILIVAAIAALVIIRPAMWMSGRCSRQEEKEWDRGERM